MAALGTLFFTVSRGKCDTQIRHNVAVTHGWTLAETIAYVLLIHRLRVLLYCTAQSVVQQYSNISIYIISYDSTSYQVHLSLFENDYYQQSFSSWEDLREPTA